MVIVEQMPWLHYVKLPHVAKLTLEEQVQSYRKYLCEIEVVRINLECGGRSQGPTKQIVQEGFLQQENLYYILQEDGSKIYVTVEKTI
jgi:hypothetical protein